MMAGDGDFHAACSSSSSNDIGYQVIACSCAFTDGYIRLRVTQPGKICRLLHEAVQNDEATGARHALMTSDTNSPYAAAS
jgi:ribulose bisphosphate carboxylase small subunit